MAEQTDTASIYFHVEIDDPGPLPDERSYDYDAETNKLLAINPHLTGLSNLLSALQRGAPDDKRRALYAVAHEQFYKTWETIEHAAYHLERLCDCEKQHS